MFLNGCLDFVFEKSVFQIPDDPYVQDQIQNQNDGEPSSRGKIFTEKPISGKVH